MLDYLRAIWRNNPVRVASIAAAGVVALASQFGVVLDEASVTETLALVVPILLSGQIARSQVTPWTGEPGPNSDDLLPPMPEPAA